ncbi:fimbrial protein [Salmonella enterica]|nr:fimbrial protein [Salmonella enterica]EGN7050679.1 fimbrial protein [Salmonella enterica]
MKKQFLAVSALALAVMSGSALAAPQDVQFVGAVTDATCNIKPEVGGTTGNYVQMGTVAKGGVQQTGIPFTLKAVPGTGNNACTLTGMSTASVSWVGNFDSDGLKAQSGAAYDAKAIIEPVNAKANAPITNANTTSEFDSNKLTATNPDGLQFTAKLKGGSQAGDYVSSAAFVVAYK